MMKGPAKELLKKLFYQLAVAALNSSNKQAGRLELIEKIASIVPNFSDQFSTWTVDMANTYDVTKIRSIHAFQVSLALIALEKVSNEFAKSVLSVVDIGDSSGTHVKYLEEIYSVANMQNVEFLSVNLDKRAVEKILNKGGRAIQARAEDLHTILEHKENADLFLSFQTLEHLFDPIACLRGLASNTSTNYFVVTVPYVKRSRVGMKHLRSPHSIGRFKEINADNTHIFELSPEDWKLIFRFSGWKPMYEEIFYMYPAKHLLWYFRYALQRYDFEGFYGVILQKNLEESELYTDW